MRFKERLRHYWHELFYKLSPPSVVEFGMVCKRVIECIDLNDPPPTWRAWVALKLHLSFCQGCHYYFKASMALRNAALTMAKDSRESVELEKLNNELLEKYARAEKLFDD